jgi:hypothetical protein
MGVIPRAENVKIVRAEVPKDFRNKNEVEDVEKMGKKPVSTGTIYRDMYEFYQHNEY